MSNESTASPLVAAAGQIAAMKPAEIRWPQIVSFLRSQAAEPVDFQLAWEDCFAQWQDPERGPAPIWVPDNATVTESNVARWIQDLGLSDYDSFYRWSIEHRAEFWEQAVARLEIRFRQSASDVLDISQGVARAAWFVDSHMNIVESCFQAPESETAIVYQRPGGLVNRMTYGELRRRTNRVANSLVDAGMKFGDAIAVVLPMTAWSVPIYLGIIQAGCLVVSIADSFAPPEIASRLQIAGAKLVFTYDVQQRAGKTIPLFKRVIEATHLPTVAIQWGDVLQVDLRDQDTDFENFLVERDQFEPVSASAQETINVLFSSGTTGDPKAIPWNHLTPIKCAIDGWVHHDIRPGQVCAWPTNLGWMMGPWLIFATLINRATIGLYEDAPMGTGFGSFVEQAGVNMLGVVPTLVKQWRTSKAMESCDWSRIHVFSSTGESSQRDEMVYLSALAGVRPIIEYCGGTEIGGGYITSTLMRPNVPAAFNTPAVGLELVLIDEAGQPGDEGEVFLVPPSIGLSNRLVNRDHFETYFAQTPELDGYPQLRRHGDYFRRLPGGVYVAGGRVDDTMNLGGIKISSAELERVMNLVPVVRETAAIADDRNGPAELVVFAVVNGDCAVPELQRRLNHEVRSRLNPLFKVSAVHVVEQLPRTASGKVMRRKLRDQLNSIGP